MITELIYRGKSIQTGDILYGSLVTGLFTSSDGDLYHILDSNALPYSNWQDIANNIDCYEVDPDTIQMYTGINDVDGNPIFTGMTVNQRTVLRFEAQIDITGVVIFDEGQFKISNLYGEIMLFSETRENKIIESF